MEWLDWAAVWDFTKIAIAVIAKVWSVLVMFILLFWAVAAWRLIPRIDLLVLAENIVKKREDAARAKLQALEPLPPKTYAENMADHERAMKRRSEGLDA